MFTVAARSSRPAASSAASDPRGPPLARNASRPYLRSNVPTFGDVNRLAAVLIFSADTLGAALLGAVVELVGHLPQFPRHGEPARDALLRVRPRHVLVDCDHEACADEFVGPALMTGARITLFRSHRATRDAGALSARVGLTVLELPHDHDQLMRLLAELHEE